MFDKRDQHAEEDQKLHLALVREGHAEDADADGGADQLPFPLEFVGEAHGEERAERVRDGDDEGIEQARAEVDSGLLGDQRRHPGGEAVKAEGLEELEHHQHDGAAAIGRLEDFREAAHRIGLVDRMGGRGRQGRAVEDPR